MKTEIHRSPNLDSATFNPRYRSISIASMMAAAALPALSNSQIVDSFNKAPRTSELVAFSDSPVSSPQKIKPTWGVKTAGVILENIRSERTLALSLGKREDRYLDEDYLGELKADKSRAWGVAKWIFVGAAALAGLYGAAKVAIWVVRINISGRMLKEDMEKWAGGPPPRIDFDREPEAENSSLSQPMMNSYMLAANTHIINLNNITGTPDQRAAAIQTEQQRCEQSGIPYLGPKN